jgi:hypothetical protein
MGLPYHENLTLQVLFSWSRNRAFPREAWRGTSLPTARPACSAKTPSTLIDQAWTGMAVLCWGIGRVGHSALDRLRGKLRQGSGGGFKSRA